MYRMHVRHTAKAAIAGLCLGLGLTGAAYPALAVTSTYDGLQPGQTIQLGDYILTVTSVDGTLSMTVDAPDEGEEAAALFEGMDASGVFDALRASVPTMDAPSVIVAETDDLLGRPGMYTSAVVFDDTSIDGTENGRIEVFADAADAKGRALYLESLRTGQWVYRNGAVLVMLDSAATPEIASGYEAAMGLSTNVGNGASGGDPAQVDAAVGDTPSDVSSGTAATAAAEPTMGEQNALRSAQNYLSFMPFSYSGLVSQLEFEGYSTEEATYAADNCGADWNEQAALKAESYLGFMSFSRDGLIEQLMFEGFTAEQAEYGVTAVGY